MYQARICINNQNNDGQYSKSFLIKMAKMGALVSVEVNIYNNSSSMEKTYQILYLENNDDFLFFKNFNGK